MQILAYSFATVATSLLVWPAANTGWFYPVVATIAGAVLIWECFALLRRAKAGGNEAELKPMRLFHWSNSYLAIIFIAMAIDPLIT